MATAQSTQPLNGLRARSNTTRRTAIQAPQFEEDYEEDANATNDQPEAHLTKSGAPDRRFKGQRDLPTNEIGNPNYRRTRPAKLRNGVHLTQGNAPDRRFKENRFLSDEDVEVIRAENILSKYKKPE